MDQFAKKLGPRLGKLREGRGITQEELEERSGVPRRTIQNIEHGQTKDPGIGTLTKLLAALGADWEDIGIAVVSSKNSRFDINDAAAFLSNFSSLSPKLQRFVWAIVFRDPKLVREHPELSQVLK